MSEAKPKVPGKPRGRPRKVDVGELPAHPNCRCSTAPLPEQVAQPACPVCSRPLFSFGPAAVLASQAGVSPVCGHCASVLSAANVPQGAVLAGHLPNGAPLVTIAFALIPTGAPPN